VIVAVLACASAFDKRISSAEAADVSFSGDTESGGAPAKSGSDTSSGRPGSANASSAPADDLILMNEMARDESLLEFNATAYCLPGYTAAGIVARKGTIAADPRILPLGSVVHIRAGEYSGTYLVLDTGAKIKGRKIDIYMSDRREAMSFGRRSVRLKIIGKVHPRHLQPK
jgi:3D (Asp-Asp-Asp) domain-containing protein